jgi:hemolysin activation/secretion protein
LGLIQGKDLEKAGCKAAREFVWQADFSFTKRSKHQLYQIVLKHALVFGLSAIAPMAIAQPRLPRPLVPLPSPPPAVPTPALPPPANLLPPPAPPAEPEAPSLEGTITVNEFKVVGSTVFSAEELAKVTAPFTGRPISFAELLQVRSAITQLYIDSGYVTSGAFIPADQVIEEGVVTIQVVEGTVAEIQVQGNQRLRASYVRDRLALATDQPLNVNRLLKALQLLQLNPLIKTLSAELTAGPQPGVSILEVQVAEARSLTATLTLDNNQLPAIGSFQRQIQINQANLLGFGDGLSVTYANTDGRNALDLSYTLPVNARNGTVSVDYGTYWSRIIQPPFDEFDIRGDLWSLGFTYRQPVIQTPTRELALGLTANRQQSQTSILGFPFPLSPGANDLGQTRITQLQFFQEWTQRSSNSVLALRSQFNLGIDAFGTTTSDIPPDSRFFSWQGQGQWVRLLAPDTLFIVRGNLQLADRPLVPIAQCGVGGLFSVRGYPQDLLLVDNCLSASAEFRIPILRVAGRKGILHVAPFVDFGTGWNNGDRLIQEDPSSLVGVGLGLRWQWINRVSASFDWGIPLNSFESGSNSLQDQGLYFSITVSPF